MGSNAFLLYIIHKYREMSNMGKDKTPKRLEDYEPGASKEQVFKDLRKVAGAKKKPLKSDSPPEQASS